MNKKAIYGKLAAIALIVAVLAAGCQGAGQGVQPTVDARPTFEYIQTQAVQTAVAQMTLVAPTAAPQMPTEAPVVVAPTEPAPTEAPPTEAPTAAPTFTALPPTAIPTNTFIPRTSTPAATATASNFNCSITESSPEFGYDIRAGGDFDGRWVVKNTGTDTWRTSEVDIKYLSGTKFQVNVDALDLQNDVAKNDSLTVIVDMLSPNSAGRYSTVWGIVRGGTTVCTLSLTIDVE